MHNTGEVELPPRDLYPGIAASVMQTKQTVQLGQDATSDPRFSAERDLPVRVEGEEQVKISGIVCLPLLRSDGDS